MFTLRRKPKPKAPVHIHVTIEGDARKMADAIRKENQRYARMNGGAL